MCSREWWGKLSKPVKHDIIEYVYKMCSYTMINDNNDFKRILLEKEKEYISKLSQQKDIVESRYIKTIDEYKIRLEERDNYNAGHHIQLMTKLNEIHNKEDTNKEKGNIGESTFDSIILSRYEDALEDTNKEFGNGDRILHFDEGSIIVEIKNTTQCTTNSNIKKYTNTLYDNIRGSKKINGDIRVGILCFMSDVKLPGNQTLCFKYSQLDAKTKILLVMVSGVSSDPDKLICAINMARSSLKLASDRNVGDTINIIENIFPDIELLLKNCDLLRQSVSVMNETINSNYSNIQNIFNSLNRVINPNNDSISKILKIIDTINIEGKPVNIVNIKEECARNNIVYNHKDMLKHGYTIEKLKKLTDGKKIIDL